MKRKRDGFILLCHPGLRPIVLKNKSVPFSSNNIRADVVELVDTLS